MKIDWAKWAFWVAVFSAVGQVLLVVENYLNLKGNGYL